MTTFKTIAPKARIAFACAFLGLAVAGCDQIDAVTRTFAAQGDHGAGDDHGHGGSGDHADEEPAKGPNGGRLLKDGEFSLELTIQEEGEEPEYRVYAYRDGKPLPPREVELTIALTRLGGRVDEIGFSAQATYLRGDRPIAEPHSFDVAVEARHDGASHTWSFASHEGRTTIEAASADAAGVRVETVGPSDIPDLVDLPGRLALAPEARAEIRPWYPGRVVAMTKRLGEPVQAGEVLARIEASDTLRIYEIKAPIGGVVVERGANVGDVPAAALYVVADPTLLQASLFAYPKDAARIRTGQPVSIAGPDGQRQSGTVSVVLPSADPATQRVTVIADLKGVDGTWRPGMAVEGHVTIGSAKAGMAVRTRALQRFRDVIVVFARVGETYEVRMLELGRRTSEWTEVLSGIEPGASYVADNSFLIRADIEKSGAGHDH